MCIFQRKIHAPVLPVVVIGLVLMSACASTGNTPGARAGAPASSPTETAAFQPLPGFSQELKVPLWENPPLGILPENAPVLTINLDLIDLSGTGGEQAAGEQAALQDLLQRTFYRNQSPRDYVRELVRVQTSEYRDMGDEARNYPDIAKSETLNWSFEEHFETTVNTPGLLVISRTRSIYTGGAHPNYDRQYFVFDREAPVHLSDLIRSEARPMLKILMNRQLRADKKLGSNDSLQRAGFFVDEAELTDHYFLSPQGLGFHWDPYEIAPYVEGYVEAIVPYGELENYLSPEGQRLAREFGNT
jgi:hypothetical protein